MPRDRLRQHCDRALAWHARVKPSLVDMDRRVRDGSHGPGLVAPWSHFTRSLDAHFAEEETVLFPALRALAGGGVPESERWRTMLAAMERELDECRTIADALRNAARDAASLESDLLNLLDSLEEHARFEEEELVPAARALLGGPAPIGPTAPDVSSPSPSPSLSPTRPEGGRLRQTARRLRGLLSR